MDAAAQVSMVKAWVREILALPAEAAVVVHDRKSGQVAIVVERAGRRTTHVVDATLAQLNWGVLARALLPLGPSCADPPAS
ncbi:MAG: hypothetical protein IT381_33510 [Deltaproteobacteria bacterium]|nr:hypothetical protein [Deltaproteobacteria bacterium]